MPPVDGVPADAEPVTAEVLAEATERIMAAITTELEVLRGETAPAGRYDPREHGITVTGPPRATTPTERSGPRERDVPPQWADGSDDDLNDDPDADRNDDPDPDDGEDHT